MVNFSILRATHVLNSESHFHFALKSRIPTSVQIMANPGSQKTY